MKAFRIFGFMITLSCLILAGCGIAQRNALMRDKYPYYPDNIKKAISGGNLVEGMDQEQVFLTFGGTLCKSSSYYKGKTVEVWSYQPDGFTGEPSGGTYDCLHAVQRVYFENGAVVGWDNISGNPSLIRDEKYGSIPDNYYVYLSKDSQYHKTAKMDLSKVFDGYYKTKRYDKILEERVVSKKYTKKEMTIDRNAKIKELLLNIEKVVSEYADKNQFRAIFNDRMPNCNEDVDITDEILRILNNNPKDQ